MSRYTRPAGRNNSLSAACVIIATCYYNTLYCVKNHKLIEQRDVLLEGYARAPPLRAKVFGPGAMFRRGGAGGGPYISFRFSREGKKPSNV